MTNKINDTTIYPITPPEFGDLLFGTDVSNVSNSPDGETVNFTVGGILDARAETTVIYNSSSGSVSTIESDILEDGYFYSFEFVDVTIDGGNSDNFLNVDLQKESDSSWLGTPGNALRVSSDSTDAIVGVITIYSPRESKKVITGSSFINRNTSTIFRGVAAESLSFYLGASADKARKVRFSMEDSGTPTRDFIGGTVIQNKIRAY